MKEAERIFTEIQSKERMGYFEGNHFSTTFALGDVFESEGKLEDAEHTYLNGIDDLKAAKLDPTQYDVDPLIICKKKLAHVYLAQKRYAEAISTLNECLKMSEDEHKHKTEFVSDVHDDLSKVLRAEGQLDEANREKDKSNQIRLAIPKNEHKDILLEIVKNTLHLNF